MPFKIKTFLKFLLISLLFTLSGHALEGLSVGDKAPRIELKTLDGKTIEVGNIEKPTVLVFYRGSWCPYCMKQLKKINSELVDELDKQGAELLAISVDKPLVAKKMKDKFDYRFPIISDQEAKSLQAFNIVNKLSGELVDKYKNTYDIDVEKDSGKTHHMIAHPAVFIVKDQKIVFADVHTNYKKRTKDGEILEALEKL